MKRVLTVFIMDYDPETKFVTTRTEMMLARGHDGTPEYEADLERMRDRVYVTSMGEWSYSVLAGITESYDPYWVADTVGKFILQMEHRKRLRNGEHSKLEKLDD